MDNQDEVRDFLRTRRERITPAQAGILGGGRRRVLGLRREEVAMLAGMSSDYYAKMERGSLAGVSDEVLEALARALQMDDAETAHLHNLARAATPAPGRLRSRPRDDAAVSLALHRFLDTNTGSPTLVQNQRGDLVAANALGFALMSPMLDNPANQRNAARFTFLDPASRSFYVDWAQGADSIVARMRMRVGRNPHDRDVTDLIGELVTQSDDFRTRWASHDVRFHRSGTKRIRHPEVGDLEFLYEGMEVPSAPALAMFAYTVEPGSPTEERVRLLGSIAVTAGDHSGPSAPSKAPND
jgi:transcriptional regulator with XRE-family HTH domain